MTKTLNSLLFVVSCPINIERMTGVQQKIFNEYRVFEKYYDVFLLGYASNGVSIIHNSLQKTIKCLNRRFDRIRICRNLCEEHGIKKCYLRNSISDPFFIELIAVLKKKGVDIVCEIPTYPYELELTHGIKDKIWLISDRLFRNRQKEYVNRFATYSNNRYIYGVKCINIHNGIDVLGKKFTPNLIQNEKEIHIIAVALVCTWHGYDRIIKGLSNYNGFKRVVVHIVGDGPAIKGLKKLAKDLNCNDNVVFHGFQSGEELDLIYNQCNLAIESLGLHRKGLYHNSSLKSREYAAKGMPFVTSLPPDLIPNDWPFLIKVPGDESPIDVQNIIEEYEKIKKIDRYREKIRLFAEENFDINQTMLPVINYYQSETTESNT